MYVHLRTDTVLLGAYPPEAAAARAAAIRALWARSGSRHPNQAWKCLETTRIGPLCECVRGEYLAAVYAFQREEAVRLMHGLPYC